MPFPAVPRPTSILQSSRREFFMIDLGLLTSRHYLTSSLRHRSMNGLGTSVAVEIHTLFTCM
jgi:hypothetical protein